MKMSPKQLELYNLLFKREDVVDIAIGGSAGGAKSYAICMMAVLAAVEYPGAKLLIGRKTSPALRSTTWLTMKTVLREAFGMRVDLDYTLREFDMTVNFQNGSSIIFLALDPHGDPDLVRLGSLEIFWGFIDEAGESEALVRNTLSSRTGRSYANQKYKVNGKIILSCNPSQNFLFEEYYKPYERLGGGEYQEWEYGKTVDKQDNDIPAYRAFLRMSVYDNPFISKDYINKLKRLPERERKRLLDGSWYYNDDASSLFTEDSFRKAVTLDYPQQLTRRVDNWNERGVIKVRNGEQVRYTTESVFAKYVGVDVADSGKDKTVVALIDNDTLVDIQPLNINKDSDLPISQLYATELENFLTRNGFTKATARNVWIEKNGVGEALCSMMRRDGWNITEYNATGKSRSAGYYDLYLDMDAGKFRILESMHHYETLRRQMNAHSVNLDGDAPRVLPKEKVRALLGCSPDFSDATYIANLARRQQISYSKKSRFRLVNV